MIKRLLCVVLTFLLLSGTACSSQNAAEKTGSSMADTTAKETTEVIQNNEATTPVHEQTVDTTFEQKESEPMDFIFPDSHKIKLTEEEIMQLDSDKQELARNEIFARKGHVFKNKKFINYFSGKAWYKPLKSIRTEELNDIEKYNVNFILFYENRYDEYAESSVKSQYKAFKENETALVDLNGDGVKEKIIYSRDNGFKLTINGISVDGDYYSNLADSFGVVDIDKNDRYKEIVISDYGPSDDLYSTYFYFNGKEIITMGQTGGLFNSGIEIDGSGKFTAMARGKILQTWFFDKSYKLTRDHKIEEVTSGVYSTDYKVFVKIPMKLYANRDMNGESFQLDEGQIVNIVGTDDKEWCQIKTASGKKGWFSVKEFCNINGEEVNASEIFAGLCYAD